MTEIRRQVAGFAGLEVPVVEVTGDRPGPRLSVVAGVHGCEYASMAGARRWANGLRYLGMSADGPDTAAPVPVYLDSFIWPRTPSAGWWEPAVRPGEAVRAGQVLGTVSTLDGGAVVETFAAPADGVVLFLTTSPAVAADGLLLGLAT